VRVDADDRVRPGPSLPDRPLNEREKPGQTLRRGIREQQLGERCARTEKNCGP
jgi:hypothetical protein